MYTKKYTFAVIIFSLLFSRSCLSMNKWWLEGYDKWKDVNECKKELTNVAKLLDKKLKKLKPLGLEIELIPLQWGSVKIQVKNIKQFIDKHKKDVNAYKEEIILGKLKSGHKKIDPFNFDFSKGYAKNIRDDQESLEFIELINKKLIKKQKNLHYVGIGTGAGGPDFLFLSRALLKKNINLKSIHLIDPLYDNLTYFSNFFNATTDAKKTIYAKKIFDFEKKNKLSSDFIWSDKDTIIKDFLRFIKFNFLLSILHGKEIDLYLHVNNNFYSDCLTKNRSIEKANFGSAIYCGAPHLDIYNLLLSMENNALFFLKHNHSKLIELKGKTQHWVEKITPQVRKKIQKLKEKNSIEKTK